MTVGTPRRVLFAWLLAATTGSTACVDERAFVVVQNQVPEEGCTIPGEVTTVYRSSGLLDVSVGKGYMLFPLIRNDLPATAALDGEPERNALNVRNFEVNLDLGRANPGGVPGDLLDFTVAKSGRMDPGQTRSFDVRVIPDLLAEVLVVPDEFRPIVTATVRAVADHGGTDLATNDFVYPVELCDGCLVTKLNQCPAGEDDLVTPTNECGLPQDSPVTCCEDPSRGTICLPGGGE